ncbi:MAG: phosphatidate cytidylyltransferase [Spirochaetes bacterium]|jgi:phosphatidate cytidylyltransferase|nr:phosphatidate cytidylyltransferase [Spirochaetota bacterium]
MRSRTWDTFQRILSALVALPVYFFLIFFDKYYTVGILVLSLIVTLACLYEFYQIASAKGSSTPFVIPGLIAAFAINVIIYMFSFGRVYGFERYLTLFDVRIIFAVFIFLGVIISALHIVLRPLSDGIYALATTVFGIVFIVVPYSHIILMKALPDGIYYIFILHLVIMFNDSFAYFGGVFFGSHKTGFPVSPNKSWEGYFSGMLFSTVIIIFANEAFQIFFDRHLFSLFEAILLGMLLSLLGDIGDLVESAIKRDAEIKDSGTIIPGHGGMWDVFDALIFVFPVFYYYLKLKGV